MYGRYCCYPVQGHHRLNTVVDRLYADNEKTQGYDSGQLSSLLKENDNMIKMPWTSSSCPHFVLEINQRCNISCKGCYKKMDGSSKPLGQIINELDIALSKRRVQTVSIAGGEPTLHPRLCEIVSNIHRRNLKVVLATNGLLLGGSLLDSLKRSGLDMVMLHIDEGQDRPDLSRVPTLEEITSLRSALAERVAASNVEVGLSVTVYDNYFDRLPSVVDYVLNSKHINYLFATNYVDTDNLLRCVHLMQQNLSRSLDDEGTGLSQSGRTTNQQIYEMLKNGFALEPFTYLPSDRTGAEVENSLTWMTYFIPVIHIEGKTERFNIKSNFMHSLLLSFPKLTGGRLRFYSEQKRLVAVIRILCSSLISRRPINGLRFLFKLRHNGAQLKSKYLIFENGPTVTENGDISCCDLCPNATVHSNQLVPVCLGDYPDLRSTARLSTGSHPG